MRYLLILLLPILASAQPMLMSGKATVPVATTAPSVSYLLSEGFEGAGTPPGWTIAGAANPDCTSPALEGTQSLFLNCQAGAQYARTNMTSSYGELWAYFLFQPTNSTTPGAVSILSLYTDGGTEKEGYVYITAALKLGVIDKSGSGGVITTDAMSAGSTYSVWVHWKNGTGTNELFTVGYSTDTTEPTTGTKFASKATGTGTNTVARVLFGNDVANQGLVIDHFRLRSDQTCGNNPP